MGMEQYSKHQQKIIKNYYRNQDSLALQRVQELVADLYLAEGKQRQTKWKQAAAALEKLGLSAQRIEHLVKEDNAALLAKTVEEFLNKKA